MELLHKLAQLDDYLKGNLLKFGLKILGAIALWVLGSFLIKLLLKLSQRLLLKRQIDSTLIQYTQSTLHIGLKLFLLLAVFGVFGVETTSFSALIAAAGVAIGMAWSGLLSNFAAGVFLILFRPFRTGDHISAAGVTGTVQEIGIFATTLDTLDHCKVFVSNNKLFSDNIFNYSANTYRRLELKAHLPLHQNVTKILDNLKIEITKIAEILKDKPIECEILEFVPTGCLIVTRVYALNKDLSLVQHKVNRLIALHHQNS